MRYPFRANSNSDSGVINNRGLIAELIPDPKKRSTKTPLLFGFLLRYAVAYGEVYAPSLRLEGVSLWLDSKHSKVTPVRALRSGVSELLAALDLKTLLRFQACGKKLEKMHAALIRCEHWYLFNLGVDPTRQRQGYATRMLKDKLSWVDGLGLPCYLETSAKCNVAFYEKFRFRSSREFEILDIKHWGMIREPAARAGSASETSRQR